MDLVRHLLRQRAMRLGTIICPGLATGKLRVCFGRSLGKRRGLPFGGSQGFLELGGQFANLSGQLPNLPFQFRYSLPELLILGQKFFVTRSGHP